MCNQLSTSKKTTKGKHYTAHIILLRDWEKTSCVWQMRVIMLNWCSLNSYSDDSGSKTLRPQNRIGRQDKLLISLNRLLSSKIPCFQKMWGRKHHSSALCELLYVHGFWGQCLLMFICCILEEVKFYHSITLICLFSGKIPFQHIRPHLKAPKSQASWIQLYQIYA